MPGKLKDFVFTRLTTIKKREMSEEIWFSPRLIVPLHPKMKKYCFVYET